jgi:hypothetical protein
VLSADTNAVTGTVTLTMPPMSNEMPVLTFFTWQAFEVRGNSVEPPDPVDPEVVSPVT